MRALILALFFLASIGHAADYFTRTGKLTTFEWAPHRYQNSEFVYDIYYFIPQSLSDTKNAPALIFLHGGGDSTLTREGANKTVQRYITDLVKLANELNFILVVPAGNGLNWGGHTRGFVRDLAALVRNDLKVDANNFGLAGHSMGGMGITRNAHWLTDQFSFFLPTAAGMDPLGATEENLITNFNTVYEHHQGLKDSFQIFIERCQNQEKVMKEIEEKYNLSSGLTVKYYDGPHNYDRPLLKEALEHHFSQTRRNLYQEKLFGPMYFIDTFSTENNIRYHQKSISSYFWIEVREANQAAYPFRLNVQAEILKEENKVLVKFEKNTEHIKKLRIYTSSKNLDLNKEIKVEVNGKLFFSEKVLITKKIKTYLDLMRLEKGDEAFTFESYIDIDLYQNTTEI